MSLPKIYLAIIILTLLFIMQKTFMSIVTRFFIFHSFYPWQEDDVHRTAGIDTVYLETTSFEMDKKDKLFLVKVCDLLCTLHLYTYVNL